MKRNTKKIYIKVCRVVTVKGGEERCVTLYTIGQGKNRPK